MNAAKSRYKTMVEDALALRGKNKNEDKKIESTKNDDIKKAPTLKPKNNGFADILILTVIVLVYAAIIINLIIKLK